MNTKRILFTASLMLSLTALVNDARAVCPYDPECLNNPYGAGSPYKSDGLMNPYSEYGSPYSNKSWRNPYATDAPRIYDSQGNYRGKLSTNPYDADSISNPYGRYGNPIRLTASTTHMERVIPTRTKSSTSFRPSSGWYLTTCWNTNHDAVTVK
jgi:hypothetical protein